MTSYNRVCANDEGQRQRLIDQGDKLLQQRHMSLGACCYFVTLEESSCCFSFNTKESKLPGESYVLGNKRRHRDAVLRQARRGSATPVVEWMQNERKQ